MSIGLYSIDRVNMNQHDKYQCPGSFRLKFNPGHTHTHTHNGPTSLHGPPIRLVGKYHNDNSLVVSDWGCCDLIMDDIDSCSVVCTEQSWSHNEPLLLPH